MLSYVKYYMNSVIGVGVVTTALFLNMKCASYVLKKHNYHFETQLTHATMTM
jgi:hypothetical protein